MDKLKEFANAQVKNKVNQGKSNRSKFDIDNWIQKHNIPVTGREKMNGDIRYIFVECPNDPNHKDAAIIVGPNGLGFKCFHNTCASLDWRAYRQIYEPGAYKVAVAIDFFNEDGQFVPPKLAEYLMIEHHFAVERGCLFVYQNGVYREIGPEFIKQRCLALLNDRYRDSRGNEVVNYIKTAKWTSEPFFDTTGKYINVLNGLIDWRSDPPVLLPHTPEYHGEIQLPVVYDPNVDCPEIRKFFSDVLQPDCIELNEEMYGYCTIPDTRHQKAFLLKSGGESGKSVHLNLLGDFLGEDNISSESLQDLSENRFRKANLAGKLANIFADIPNKAIEDTDTFKALVVGDWITGERKGKDPFKFKNTARLIFSCNELPRTKDNSYGFFRRWVILDFPNTFPVGNPRRDPNLLDKLTTQTELSGLLNLAICGLKRLMRRGAFLVPLSATNALKEYLLSNDSAKAFFSEHVKLSPNDRVSRRRLYECYKHYCRENELLPVSERKFCAKVREAFPDVTETNYKERMWGGIQVDYVFSIFL